MRRTWLASLLAVLATVWLPSAALAQEQVVQIGTSKRSAAVRIIVGKSESLRTDRNFSDVIVSDAEVADIVPLTDRSMSLLGKKIGTTRVSVYGEGKSLVGVFDVEVTYDTSVLASELRDRFPGAQFRVTSVNGRIMLSGIAPDAVTVDKAVSIAKQFGPQVINTVKVLQPQQVMLEVRFVEASRSASRELGINWNAVTNNFQAALGTGGLLSGSAPFGVIVGRILGSGVQVDVMIRALEERGVVRRLAEPNLIALSGDTASFLAGGEFPIPVASTNNTVTVEWKKFGVGLAFTPTVLENGVINLKVEPEVSQLDPNNTIQIGTIRLPVSRCGAPTPRWSCATGKASPLPACCRASRRPIRTSFPGSGTCRSSVRCCAAPRSRSRKPISPSSSRRTWCGRPARATRCARRSTIR